MLLSHFINGLKEEIKAEIRLMNPICLEQAVKVEEMHPVTNSRRTNVNTTSYGKEANTLGLIL